MTPEELDKLPSVPWCSKCKITKPAETREDIKVKVMAKLSEFLHRPDVSDLDEETSFKSLGFTPERAREFERLFFVYVDEVVDLDEGSGLNYSNVEPQPVDQFLSAFITKVHRVCGGIVYRACDAHAY